MPSLRFAALVRRAALGAAVCAIAGCGDITPPPRPPSEGPADFPDTPDKLAANFLATYENSDFDTYRRLLAPDFVMPLQAAAAASYPDLSGAIDRDEAMGIHERLFSRQDVTDPDGQVVPAVQTITFQSWTRTAAWTAAGSGDGFPGTQWAPYEVVILFDRGDSRSLLKVQGSLRLHVVARDSVVAGVTKPYHELMAIIDLTQDALAADPAAKVMEPISFGRLLGIWRPPLNPPANWPSPR